MITAVDTNILLDVLSPETPFGTRTVACAVCTFAFIASFRAHGARYAGLA
jgi:hypothetical protein